MTKGDVVPFGNPYQGLCPWIPRRVFDPFETLSGIPLRTLSLQGSRRRVFNPFHQMRRDSFFVAFGDSASADAGRGLEPGWRLCDRPRHPFAAIPSFGKRPIRISPITCTGTRK